MYKEYNKKGKTSKYRIISITLIVCILSQFIVPFNISNSANEIEEQDVYDVILFWGQSNMVGSCGLKENEKLADTRYEYNNSSSVDTFSNKTGIDKGILSRSEKMNFVKVKQEENTVFEYNYINDKIVELTENTKKLGEKLIYNSQSGKLEVPTSTKFSIQKSYGTNMIPQFCKEYYEKTGRKVVAVFAANGGENIENFLPSDDIDYGDANNQMIYEAMLEKYQAAINYMEKNDYKVENKLWICFQGESNIIKSPLTTSEYERIFMKVHNNLKKDAKITQGAIIETSTTIGTKRYERVETIHQAQENLALKNDDIIIGSSYAYNRYIPDEETYNSSGYSNSIFINSNGEKLAYDEAFDIASASVCYPDNTIHFTSAALSQIGKECAQNFAKHLDSNPPEITVEYSETKNTNKDVMATISANEKIREVEGWTLSEGGKKLSKLYKTNGSEIVKVYDLVGNSIDVKVDVLNIDKDIPQVTVNYSTKNNTNKDVKVTIEANETMQEIEGWTISGDKKKLTKVYTKNKNETVIVYDLAGNSVKAEIKISNIDKEAPQLTVNYSTTEKTNQNVEVIINANEKIKKAEGWSLSEDGKKLSKLYGENGSETVKVYDLVGNSIDVEVVVLNIDKDMPQAIVNYSTKDKTSEDVKVTIEANEKIQEIEGWTISGDKKKLIKVYTKNKNETVIVYDLAQNATKVNINIDNIDKIGPEYEVLYSTTKRTNQDVKVKIIADEEMKEIEGWTLSEDRKNLTKDYIKNSSETVMIYDSVGNKSKVDVKIVNIDKENPECIVKYNIVEKTNENVVVTIEANEELQEVEGWSLSEDAKKLMKVFRENKNEIVVLYDIAGNSIKQNINITNIDKIGPEIEVLYSTTKLTNQDVEVNIISDEEIKEVDGWNLSADKKRLVKVFKENTNEIVLIYDIVGNYKKVEINVSNIEKMDEKLPEIIPNAGNNDKILIGIALSLIFGIVILYIKHNKLKDIK